MSQPPEGQQDSSFSQPIPPPPGYASQPYPPYSQPYPPQGPYVQPSYLPPVGSTFAPPPRTNGLAVSSMVLGIVGISLECLYSFSLSSALF
jgi:hypothetical protein